MFGGRSTTTGTVVNETSAMASPAFFSGVAAVSETLGSLSLKVFRRRANGGKDEDRAHPLYERVHLNPNPEITTMMWREMKQAHLLMGGNAYSEIVRENGGSVTELWPIHPNRVTPERLPSGALVYVVRVPGMGLSAVGQPIQREREVVLRQDQMLHVRGISLDGLCGLSRLALHRESIGHALDLQEYGARFFGNGGIPGGVLEHPGTLTKTAQDNLRKSWEETHAGLSNSHRLAILEEGMKWHNTGVENEKAQYLDSRQFQVGETARILRVPGILIGHDDKASTYASAEQFFLAYVVHTVRAWVVRWDQQLTLSLLTESERRTHFIEHSLDSLLRGDALTRAQANEVRWRNGTLSINEWRAMENDNPLPDDEGERYFVPLNMVPLDQVDTILAQKTEPAAPAAKSPQNTPATTPNGNRHDQLLRDLAERALRREVQAVRKLGERETDPEAWRAAVDAFYARHTAYLAEVFHVSLERARGYTTEHRAEVLAEGPGAADYWEDAATAELIELATAG
jgi:HK97 family phage portal protein